MSNESKLPIEASELNFLYAVAQRIGCVELAVLASRLAEQHSVGWQASQPPNRDQIVCSFEGLQLVGRR